MITHELMCVEPRNQDLNGWLYAFFGTSTFRMIAIAEHYGHVVKHLEVAHLDALPVLTVERAAG